MPYSFSYFTGSGFGSSSFGDRWLILDQFEAPSLALLGATPAGSSYTALAGSAFGGSQLLGASFGAEAASVDAAGAGAGEPLQ